MTTEDEHVEAQVETVSSEQTEKKRLSKWWLAVPGTLIAVFALSSISRPPISEQSEICGATIAMLMNQNPQTIRFRNVQGISFLAYGGSDGLKYQLKCKIRWNRITWGMTDGRWRTDPLDSKITYKKNKTGSGIVITETFSDGTSQRESFSF